MAARDLKNMNEQLRECLAQFHGGGTARDGELAAIEREFGCELPKGFRGFHKTVGAREGAVGDHYLIVWAAVDVPTLNREYEVPKYAPGLLLFGSNRREARAIAQ